MSYEAFLLSKSQFESDSGFAPVWLPDSLFDFQAAMVEWALRRGRAALFEDCGLGKTLQQLVWAENVVRKTNRPVLVIAPLAVSAQTVAEGARFGIEVTRSPDGTVKPGINITNYERLEKFDSNDFSGAVCDESSAIKSFSGVHRKVVTEFMRRLEYRLLCTATAAPNDYIELGTSSEALGQLGHMDMLNRFFKNDQNTSDTKGRWQGHGMPRQRVGPGWRFKGHAEDHFWRWVCSWARALRRPSDLGFSDERFALPSLVEREHLVAVRTKAPGLLFDMPAVGLQEEREEQRRSLVERCEKAAALLSTDQPGVAWCHLNKEGDALARLIPGAVQVSGSDEPEAKEEKFLAFSSGQTRVLVIKPKIGAFGLNWQHCAHMTFFPSHSFEQYYQAVRRCWRFGQTRDVLVDVVTTESGHDVMANLQRKARAADAMFSRLVANMNDAMAVRRRNDFTQTSEVPAWLT